MRSLLAGTLNPWEGVRQLYDFCLAADYDDVYKIWCCLDDGLESIEAGDIPSTLTASPPKMPPEIVCMEAKRFREAFGQSSVI